MLIFYNETQILLCFGANETSFEFQYSGWAPQNRHIYQQVPVKFWQQGKMETIVEFLRDEMILDDR